MKRNDRWIMAIVLVFAVALTAWATTMLQITVGAKRLVNSSDWNELNDMRIKYKKIEDVERYIKSNYYKSTEDVNFVESQIKGLFSELDPYSSFLDKDMYRDLLESNSGEFVGIGIQISTDELGYTYVESPIPDTPAEKVGLKTGDRIFEVDGIDVVGKNI